ncbi:hypothetical protein [Ideonella alba]|uniref:PsiF repeat-containing protein n=1 Tax=Ideonella alba TaxID=2824118 RepID=A0A940YAJ0_9BURK|nr:hypothetical protein [Ideonella alba]MBQ0929187.1 hypothetical protein [Ideonella alba]
MNAKQLIAGLAAVLALGLGSASHAAVTVKAAQPAQATKVASADSLLGGKDPEERCERKETYKKYVRCLCRKGVDLPNCPPSKS